MLIVNKHSNDGQMRLTDRRHDADGAAQDPAAGRGPRQGLGECAKTRTQDLSARNHEGAPAHQGHLWPLQGKTNLKLQNESSIRYGGIS